MKRKLAMLCGIPLIVATILGGCSTSPEQGAVDIGQTADQKVAAEILAEEKNKVVTVGGADANFSLSSVTQAEDSSLVANKKFELDIEATTEGNVYDPSEVDIYGQFVSPSGELYEMPAFYYKGWERSFDAYDLSGTFDITSGGEYFAQNSATMVGVLDEKEGEETPVGRITFNVTDASGGGNGGAVLSKGSITSVHDTVSVWLRKGENFVGDAVFLYFYGNEDQAWVKIEGSKLTEDWKKFDFYYGSETETVTTTDGAQIEVLTAEELAKSDFTHSPKTTYHRPLTHMYSGRIQTSDSLNDRYTATGDIYISDMQFYNSELPGQTVQLASFVCESLEGYQPGDLFGNEVLTETGESGFKLRFRFTEAGEWTYRIVGKKNGEEKFRYTSSVTATENPDEEQNRGIIRIEPTQKRNFVFEDGTPYLPIGMNLAYSVDKNRGSYDYDVYFPKMAAAGMNYSRTWLTDIDAGYGVQDVSGGILNFDARQYKACQFDNILELAEEYGIYLQIPMQAITPFRKDDGAGEKSHRWDTNPYNKINGGYLDEPWEYFTDSRAIEDTKKLYRYYVARFGYSRNILGWELMNEIGMDSTYYGTDLLTQEQAKQWAEEIGNFMHGVDPYDHLVTISSGNDHYDAAYGADAVDFMNFHSYVFGSNYSTGAANECYALWQHFNKPVLIGEMGASGTSEAYNHDRDPNGLMNKQTAFSAPMGGSAGGAMTFWWQQVNNYDQYDNWTPAAEYFKLLPDDFILMNTLTKEGYTVGGTNAQRVAVYGFVGADAVYAYITDMQYNYANTNPGTFADTTLEFAGLADGSYTVQVFDTNTGKVAKTFDAAAAGGKLSISLESWACDLALIIDRKA